MTPTRIRAIGAAALLCASSLTLGLGTGAPASAAPVGPGFNITVADLQFILQQIRIAETNATREGGNLGQVTPPTSLVGTGANQIPDARLPWGLRQVDGRNNNLTEGRSVWSGRTYTSTAGKSAWGAADQPFVRLTAAEWREADEPSDWMLDNFPGAPSTNYDPIYRPSNIEDHQPRLVSNLIADQSANNPAAVIASGGSVNGLPVAAADVDGSLPILNTAPNAGVAAPYNGMFVLFGQFFDHGLDLVGKTGSENVVVPLQPDDPLYVEGARTNFMVANRTVLDANDNGVNTTTPWIDQNQTYTSHPSHQVFLREYARPNNGRPVSTGLLYDGATAGNIANWTEIKAQARTMLGIALVDSDIFDVPLMLTDEYGRFLRGPNGYPQLVQTNGSVVEGNPASPISTASAARTGHAFLDDIAHTAVPKPGLQPDADGTAGGRPASGFYDDELLGQHFITGDGRGNENIGLTAIHTVFHAEHNRLIGQIKSVITANAGSFATSDWYLNSTVGQWNGERLFQAARFVNEMEYQHLVFGEFVRAFQPAIKPFAVYDPTLVPDITAEFAHAVYRFGHSQLMGNVLRVNADGSRNDKTLLAAFLNPGEFNNGGTAGTLDGYQAAGSIARGMTYQVANEIDEFTTNTLRNSLVGLPLDLATLNMVRARDTGMGSLNQVRRSLYASTNGNSSLAPYDSWNDFGFALRHRASLVNFVAAYGTHPSITSKTTIAERRAAAQLLVNDGVGAPADRLSFMGGTDNWANPGGPPTTGLESIDLWIGGLAEKRTEFGGMLGSTFDYVFTRQMEHLQDGDRLYYLGRLAGMPLINEIETNFFAEIIQRNTDVEALPANVFFYPARTFMQNQSPATYNDIDLLSDGTWRYGGDKHVVFNGTAAANGQWSSVGDDTLRGNDGSDRLQGGGGNDFVIGGLGNDVIQDTSGLDILMGGDDNDLIRSGGVGADALLGGTGRDVLVGGTDATAITSGTGDDVAMGSTNADGITGDDGSDWLDGGVGVDGMAGDLIAPFGIDLGAPGDDVLIGGAGDDLLDGGGRVDISIAGLGNDSFIGGFGFDWQTYYDPDPTTAKAANGDLALAVPPVGNPAAGLVDIFDQVEALSGGDLNDTLLGDIRDTLTVPLTNLTDILNQPDIAKIDGLAALLGFNTTRWDAGNILIGGRGSDILEGRGGNDLIDGDAWLDALLSVPASSGVTGVLDPSTGRILVRNAALLSQAIADGRLAIADITIVRRIDAGAYAGEQDVARFSGNRGDYTISYPTGSPGTVRVVDNVAGRDGTDTLRNIERLTFLDGNITPPMPTAPRNVTTVSSPTSLQVSWSAPGFLGGASITGYTVSAFTSPTTTNNAITCSTNGGTSCTLSGLTAWTRYYVEVRANATAQVNGNTTTIAGEPSTRILAVPGTPPGAPTGVTPSVFDATTIDISWTAPSDGGSPITGYTVTAWSALTGGTAVTSCSTTGATTCALKGVSPGVLYWVDVVASNLAGTGSPSSPRVGAVTNSAPSAPRTVAVSTKSASLDVSWSAPVNNGGYAITKYVARAYSSLSGNTLISSCELLMTLGNEPLTCTIPNLVNGRTYGVDVVAFNQAGAGPASTPRVSGKPVAPPSAPGAPTLTAYTGALGAAWTAPTSNGGSAITSYTATAYQGAFPNMVSAGSCSTTGALTCIIGNLQNGTQYWVGVVAANIAGPGLESTRTTGTTLSLSAPPAPTMTQTTATSGTAVSATWSAPLSDGGSAILGYTARAWAAGGALAGSCTTNGALTCSITTGLTIGTQYAIDVVARNAIGTGSASNQMMVTTMAAPAAPTNVGATATSGGTVAVSWQAPSNGGSVITGYTARAFSALTGGNAVASCPANGSTLTCTISGLNANTDYYVDVVATNAIGTGAASSPRVLVRTSGSTIPDAPTIVSVTAGSRRMQVNWTAPASNGGAPILDYTARAWTTQNPAPGATPFRTCTATGATATTCTITNLTRGTTYWFDVVARNAVGTSLPSAMRQGTAG